MNLLIWNGKARFQSEHLISIETSKFSTKKKNFFWENLDNYEFEYFFFASLGGLNIGNYGYFDNFIPASSGFQNNINHILEIGKKKKLQRYNDRIFVCRCTFCWSVSIEMENTNQYRPRDFFFFFFFFVERDQDNSRWTFWTKSICAYIRSCMPLCSWTV